MFCHTAIHCTYKFSLTLLVFVKKSKKFHNQTDTNTQLLISLINILKRHRHCENKNPTSKRIEPHCERVRRAATRLLKKTFSPLKTLFQFLSTCALKNNSVLSLSKKLILEQLKRNCFILSLFFLSLGHFWVLAAVRNKSGFVFTQCTSRRVF